MPLSIEGFSEVTLKFDLYNPFSGTSVLLAQLDEGGNIIDTQSITASSSNDFSTQTITKAIVEGCVSIFAQVRLTDISEYCYIDNVQLYAS